MASAPDLRSDTEALTEIIEQASLALDTIPNLHPSLASVRESLTAALALSREITENLDKLPTASSMGKKRGEALRDEKGPGYFRELAGKRDVRAGGRPRKSLQPGTSRE